MTTTITTDPEAAIARMIELGYDREQVDEPFARWLARGDDVLVFSNHDLGSLTSRILGFAMPWERADDTPRQGPDGDWGPGWRYLPDLRLTVKEDHDANG